MARETTRASFGRADIDWEFISKHEGGQLLRGYVPGHGGVKCGVTVATGVDLGVIASEQAWQSRGIAPELLKKIRHHIGLRGEDAVISLARRPLEVTKQEADWMDDVAFDWLIMPFQRQYDMRAPGFSPTAKKLAELPTAIRTALCSVVWNMGIKLSQKAPRFDNLIMSQDWRMAAVELYHWNGFGRTDELIKTPRTPVERGLLLRRRSEGLLIASAIGVSEQELKDTKPKDFSDNPVIFLKTQRGKQQSRLQVSTQGLHRSLAMSKQKKLENP